MELTEYTISERLALFRADQEGFVYPSFDTIAGSGSNGAIIHYKVCLCPLSASGWRVEGWLMFKLCGLTA